MKEQLLNNTTFYFDLFLTIFLQFTDIRHLLRLWLCWFTAPHLHTVPQNCRPSPKHFPQVIKSVRSIWNSTLSKVDLERIWKWMNGRNVLKLSALQPKARIMHGQLHVSHMQGHLADTLAQSKCHSIYSRSESHWSSMRWGVFHNGDGWQLLPRGDRTGILLTSSRL